MDNTLSVNDAFKILNDIRLRCPDINFKVITTDDIYSSLGLDEEEHSQACEKELREVIRNSWEMKHWSNMWDDDWEFFYDIHGIKSTLAKYGETKD